MVEGFGYEMFTGYMGSHSVVLSSILLEERQGRRDMSKWFWIC